MCFWDSADFVSPWLGVEEIVDMALVDLGLWLRTRSISITSSRKIQDIIFLFEHVSTGLQADLRPLTSWPPAQLQ